MKVDLIETVVGLVPKSWCIQNLEDISGFITKGGTPTTYGFDWADEDSGVPFFRSECVTDNGFNLKGMNFIHADAHRQMNRSEVKPGDLLMTITGNIGRVARAPIDFFSANINQHIARIRIQDGLEVSADYVYQCLKHDGYVTHYRAILTGQAYPQISLQQVRETPIPLPTFPEQQKIATILTAVDDKMDVIARQIEATQGLKQGLMQTLFSWGVGTQDAADWPTVPLQEVAEVRTGVAKGKKGLKEPAELPYLRVANVQDGHIDLAEVKTIAVEAAQLERYALQPGDVLMTEGGDFDKLGRGDVWKGQISPCLHQNHVFAVRPDPSKLNSYYLAALAASDYGRQYFLSCSKRTTNLASINSSQLKTFPVLLPPLDEQVRIADIVAAANARIETLKTKKAHYQTLKRGLMQKLLTGEWRVKLDSLTGTA
ncbi:restriction endonuclease subunit S [Pseudomonas sp. SWRI154]|uniref:restriction endonuclease subunit S n=1 Tax=Pseudomonas sp. SWRI154 TaxID=2745501 RepID=UPI001644942E|nr:restriction endonuclease subunit S [Pseudomonas sp. SWRI154]MBC3363499.1 restriction endonuclease subunit S [Pseudomonas sp. SWRI154]